MSNAAEVIVSNNQGIAVYDEFRSQLAALKEGNAKLVFDYEDPKGNKEARSHVYKLRQTKAAVDKARQKEKAASLEYGRRVDSEAKEIAAEIDAMIEVHAKPLEAIEERERQRVQAIRDRIEEMRSSTVTENPPGSPLSAEAMRDRLAEIKAVAIDETFAEFIAEAAQVKDATVSAMEANIAATEKREAEAAELERLRKESEERARKDREEQIRREAEQKAVAEAETKAKAEREAAERRELELKLAAERAEREKIEAQQRAERAAKEAEERVRREAEEAKRKEAEATAKREADKAHRGKINSAAVAAFVAGGMDEEVAKLAVTLIAKGQIPAVSIAY